MSWEELNLPDLSHRINGERISANDEEKLSLIDPCTGNSYGEVAIASATTVDAAVSAAQSALLNPEWADIPPLARETLMHGTNRAHRLQISPTR